MTQHAHAPLVSIALCTYNGARYLREQLDSLLTQTYGNLEIIAVDDASTDESAAILQEYQQRDARLHVSVNPVNLGFTRNFEHAMQLCRGEFIAPCDQDDIWLPEKVAVLVAVIGTHALAYCDSEFIDENGSLLPGPMSSRCNMISSRDPAQFAAANCVAGHAMLFRRELLGKALPVPECFFHDWWLAAVAASGGGVTYCNRRLVRYRLHDSNVTNVLRERPAVRQRGRRETRLRNFGLRVARLAALPGASSAFLERLHHLWVARENQWFSFELAGLMYRHWWRLNAVRKVRWRMLPAMGFAVGLRLKRVLNPQAYRHG